MSFDTNSPSKQQTEESAEADNQKTPKWGLKVDKINPSLGKLRKPDFLKTPSSEIMISGIHTRELSSYLHHELEKIGEIVEIKMKWLKSGDMLVKFADPNSAKKAMAVFDGIYLWGAKLKVTQILKLKNVFKPKIGRFLNKTKLLPQIKENEESSDGEKVSSSENEKYSPTSIIDNEEDTLELIKKNITDLIDNEDPQDNEEAQIRSDHRNNTSSSNMGLEYSNHTQNTWDEEQKYYEQEDF
mmetsp:Transcript_24422/g.24317  ORF Transcript_24422/g.24317 Transcript_24422/m.24317 type:complete len:242 (-) Transcript_24422:1634-2359(-)